MGIMEAGYPPVDPKLRILSSALLAITYENQLDIPPHLRAPYIKLSIEFFVHKMQYRAANLNLGNAANKRQKCGDGTLSSRM